MSTITSENTASKRKPSRKTDALLARWNPVADLVDATVRIEWAAHSFYATIRSVDKARLVDVTNTPEPRYTKEGKKYTPTIINIVTDEGVLQFVDEDVKDIIVLMRGVIIKLNEYDVVLKRKV